MFFFLPALTLLMVVVGAALIFIAMRRYPKLHAMLQAPGFKFEIDGESEQPSEDSDSEHQD